MPYIQEAEKERLAKGEPIQTAGNLTYLLQQLIRQYWTNSPQNYATIAEILGSLRGAEFDFERRIVKDYEIKKREANGDVW
jgi:hypothetical protein